MREVLNKIFARKLGVGKFALSGLAFITGFTLVLLALQGYTSIRDYITPKRTTSNYVILNKEVQIANTLFGGKAQFTKEELSSLRREPFVEDMGVFHSNNFHARAHVGGDLGFRTELFFESVPAQFVDDKPANFVWYEGDNFVPIIISQEFLNLYNFGYAVSKGTPQLSKSTIQLVPLRVDVAGPGGSQSFDAKVVGFSDRISSVLVPAEFLAWTNRNIGGTEAETAARVIVKLRSDKAHLLDDYLSDHNLRVSDEKLKYSKILTAMNVVMSVLVAIGMAFMVFALVIVTVNFSLMVTQAKEEVSLLLQLGYKTSHLVRHLVRYLIVFMIVVAIVSSILFFIGNRSLVGFLNESGFAVRRTLSEEVVSAGLFFIIVSFMISFFSIRRLIKKQLQSNR